MQPLTYALSMLLILVGCQPKPTDANVHIRNTMATIYVQQSPEYIALAEQAYSQARISLDKRIKNAENPLAVVLDIDETVLDNSPFLAKQILENFSYPTHWDEWIKREEGQPIPGSQEFLRYADSLKIAVFYISNRKQHLLKATINNLRKYGYPNTDSEHILLRSSTPSKKERRQKVRDKGFEIALLIGDNLDDMSAEFEVDDPVKRKKAVLANHSKFGIKYIVLPNPIYGKWAQNRGFYDAKLNQDSLAAIYLNGF